MTRGRWARAQRMVLGETQLPPSRVLATYVTETNFCERALALRRRLVPSREYPPASPSVCSFVRSWSSFAHFTPWDWPPITGRPARIAVRNFGPHPRTFAAMETIIYLRCAFDTRPEINEYNVRREVEGRDTKDYTKCSVLHSRFRDWCLGSIRQRIDFLLPIRNFVFTSKLKILSNLKNW